MYVQFVITYDRPKPRSPYPEQLAPTATSYGVKTLVNKTPPIPQNVYNIAILHHPIPYSIPLPKNS